AFAAEAYARVTNRPGVCDGTLGPGATNLVTGLIEGLNAGTPMIALAGDTNRAHSWKNMTQECRQAEILRPAVKELVRVELPGRRRHPSLGGTHRTPRFCRGAVDPGRPHDERERRYRLHPPAFGRAVRALLTNRQRADRGLGLPPGHRLQARRNCDQALCPAA